MPTYALVGRRPVAPLCCLCYHGGTEGDELGFADDRAGGLAMFGLIERRRLAKYERTLKRAKTDVVHARILYAEALMRSLNMVRTAAQMNAQHPDALELRTTLSETIETIPLPYLSDINALLVRSIRKPRSSQHGQAFYQMPVLLNGLIYARLVEWTKPKFAARAYAFRLDALGFMEPLLQDGREILRRREANR